MVRLFHFSDTHLGHQQYPRIDSEGLNQREQDHYAAFHAVVDRAIEEKVDLVLHVGDLFDGVRPSNRALGQALDGFLKLSRAGIPTVIIAGNHEHPKLRETGSPLRLFSHLPHIHPVYRGARETVEVQGQDGTPLRVHAVPQCADNATLAREVAAIRRGPEGLDVLMLHGEVGTLKAFSHAEFNQQSLETAWFDDRFDYVALGHYHGVQQVAERAWYCGAPERVSIAESGQEKGWLDVRVERGRAQADFRPLPARPYVDLSPLDAGGMDGAQVVAASRGTVARLPAGAVARLRICNLDPSLRGGLDLRAVREAGRHLLHLDLSDLHWRDTEHRVEGATSFGSLADEFEAFAAATPMEGVERGMLLKLARQILAAEVPP
jgi:predicted phosphodiesterase